MYMNTTQPDTFLTAEDAHNYENYEPFRQRVLQQNPYEDEVQTVHSEGVRSECNDPPPLPDRPAMTFNNENGEENEEEQEEEEMVLGLGELSEADERVQRFYGILPKEKEIKTVRMVKRDHKEQRLSKGGKRGDEDSEEEELPPPPLPRGNYQLHSFFNGGSEQQQQQTAADQKASFKLGEYYRRGESTSSASNSRPGSSLSAHERLFGVSRDESLSPDMSPAKSTSLASSDSAQSALMSPVFKSAAARAIIEEERKTPMIIPRAGGKKKSSRKQRHMTVTGSHPSAVLEAISRHEAEQARSRDDLDMERILKPSSTRRDAPDVVRSTYVQEEVEIDNLFGAPNKIKIPERYVPEQVKLFCWSKL